MSLQRDFPGLASCADAPQPPRPRRAEEAGPPAFSSPCVILPDGSYGPLRIDYDPLKAAFVATRAIEQASDGWDRSTAAALADIRKILGLDARPDDKPAAFSLADLTAAAEAAAAAHRAAERPADRSEPES